MFWEAIDILTVAFEVAIVVAVLNGQPRELASLWGRLSTWAFIS